MPIQTRCPSCSAAVPTGAVWCSLCHSDLRPRSTPRASAPLPSSTIVVAPLPGSVLEDTARHPDPDHRVGLDPDPDLDADLDDEPVPVGRHSREAAPTAPASRSSRALPSRGKHGGSTGGGRRTASRPAPTDLASLGALELPAPGEATPEQVDLLAEAMLTRLAVSEPQPRLLDPDEFPGGRWGFAAAALGAVIVLLLVVYTVLGLVVR